MELTAENLNKPLYVSVTVSDGDIWLLVENHNVGNTGIRAPNSWSGGYVQINNLSGASPVTNEDLLEKASIDLDYGVHFWPSRVLPTNRLPSIVGRSTLPGFALVPAHGCVLWRSVGKIKVNGLCPNRPLSVPTLTA